MGDIHAIGFVPDVTALRTLASSINKALDVYDTTNDLKKRSHALSDIADDAQRLRNATTSPEEVFSDFIYQPLANAAIRIALAMGLFTQLPAPGEGKGLTIERIAVQTQTEPSLCTRVLRTLVAFDIINLNTDTGMYSNTEMSVFYADPSRHAYTIWLWDVMIASACRGLAPYLDEHSKHLINPTDPHTSPFSLAHDARGKHVFEIVQSTGKLPLLNAAMSGSNVMCARDAVAAYDFAALQPGDDGVVLVDVGGAQGQTIQEIRAAAPSRNGTFVLQDLQSVLPDHLPNLDAELMPYDFFAETQPVRGAAAYYYQRIFHDWNDVDSGRILASLKPAMGPNSKLLICDVVVQDERPHRRKTLRDINMLLIGGMERSEKQWRQLLDDNGFVVEKFYGLENADNSIIEARLK